MRRGSPASVLPKSITKATPAPRGGIENQRGFAIIPAMHVLYVHDKVIWIFAGLGFFWLHILFGLLLSDYIFRGWVGVPGK